MGLDRPPCNIRRVAFALYASSRNKTEFFFVSIAEMCCHRLCARIGAGTTSVRGSF
jgi:hypothetical protein